MVENMKAIGWMDIKMAKVNTFYKIRLLNLEYGKKVKGYNGFIHRTNRIIILGDFYRFFFLKQTILLLIFILIFQILDDDNLNNNIYICYIIFILI